jgi:predicted PurR-regulated permease PerM
MRNGRMHNTAMTFLVIAGILLLMIYAQGIMVPIMIAAFLAMLMVPLVYRFEQLKIPRVFAIIFSLLIFILFIGAVGYFFGMQIGNFTEDLTDIQQRFNEISNQLQTAINQLFGIQNALNVENLNDQLLTYVKSNAGKLFGVAFSTLGRLGLFILIPVYVFMFLLYRDHFMKFIIKLFKNEPSEKVVNVVTDLRQVIQHYILGMLKVMAILAALNAIGLMILGITLQKMLFLDTEGLSW